MLNAISLVIEQRKNEFDRIAKVWFTPSIFMPCEGDISFRTPLRIYFYLRNIYAKKPRYDYNLMIMKSPKPATDNRFKK